MHDVIFVTNGLAFCVGAPYGTQEINARLRSALSESCFEYVN